MLHGRLQLPRAGRWSMSRVMEESRAKLFEDKVVRRVGALRREEILTLAIDEVIHTLESREEESFLELHGSRSLSGEEKFRIDLGHTRWQHQVDAIELRLRLIVYSHEDTSRSEQYHFKMNSRQQLASWAAELIQASTFHSENQMRRCFHIRITKEDTSRETDTGISAILQAFHPNDCKVVVRDPITLSHIRVYDMATLATLSLECQSLPRIAFRLHDWATPKVTINEQSITFHAVRVAEEALKFLESFMSLKMPHVYRSVQRKVTEETAHRRLYTATIKRNVRVVLEVPEVDAVTRQYDVICHSLEDGYEVPVELLSTHSATDERPKSLSQTATCSASPGPPALPVKDIIRPGVVVPRYNVLPQKKLKQSASAIYEIIGPVH